MSTYPSLLTCRIPEYTMTITTSPLIGVQGRLIHLPPPCQPLPLPPSVREKEILRQKKGTENESGSEVGRWVAGGCGAPSTPTQPKHGCGPGCPPSRPMAWARSNTHCRAPSPMAGGPQGHTPRASPAGAILHHQEGAESGDTDVGHQTPYSKL